MTPGWPGAGSLSELGQTMTIIADQSFSVCCRKVSFQVWQHPFPPELMECARVKAWLFGRSLILQLLFLSASNFTPCFKLTIDENAGAQRPIKSVRILIHYPYKNWDVWKLHMCHINGLFVGVHLLAFSAPYYKCYRLWHFSTAFLYTEVRLHLLFSLNFFTFKYIFQMLSSLNHSFYKFIFFCQVF